MPTKWIPYVKALVHLVCLVPFVELLQQYNSGAFGLMADPVNYITHQVARYWALFLLIAYAWLSLQCGGFIRSSRT